ncbi:MAG TPA: glycosyltransferase family 4 protein [Galbitalea sp.]
MRILIISNLLPPRVIGGYEIACWNIAKGLRERGHDVVVLTSPTERPITENQDFVERSLAMHGYTHPHPTEPHIKEYADYQSVVSVPDNTRLVLDALRRFRPDHVIAFNLVGIGSIAIIDLLNAVGVPWTMNLGDRVPNTITEAVPRDILELYGLEDGAAFRLGSHAIISQTLADEIAAGSIDLGNNVKIISRGIRPSAEKRGRAYRDGGVSRFNAAGAISEHKGVGIIVDAAALLRARGIDDFTVDVYGDGEREEFTRRAAAAGVEEHVRFPGAVQQAELFRRNASADAFLFPTWPREPFGSAPLEAAAVGCVPILTSNCGAAERLVDGVDALKVERTAEAFADAMERVIRGDIDLESFGRAGMERIAGPLSFERSLVELEEFIASFARPDWADATLDDPAVATDVLAKNSRGLELLFTELAIRDIPVVPQRSNGDRARAAARAARDVALGGARALVRRARGETLPPPVDPNAVLIDEMVVSLRLQNEVHRKDNLALRHQLGWADAQGDSEMSRRV